VQGEADKTLLAKLMSEFGGIFVSTDKPSAESSTHSSDQAVNESVTMLSSYFDLTQKSNAPLHPDVDNEPLPSMFSRNTNGAEATYYTPSRGKSPTLIVIGSFLILVACGILFSFFNFASDKEAVVSVARSSQSVETETSLSSAAPEVIEIPPVLPEPTMASDEPWSDTMEAYKELLAKQDASKASARSQTANDPVLGKYEAWLKGKPQ
jgi:hypothetical protein